MRCRASHAAVVRAGCQLGQVGLGHVQGRRGHVNPLPQLLDAEAWRIEKLIQRRLRIL